jgi:hypothetical protein
MTLKPHHQSDPAENKRRAKVIEKYLRQGYPPKSNRSGVMHMSALGMAAKELGLADKQQLRNAIDRGRIIVNWKLFNPGVTPKELIRTVNPAPDLSEVDAVKLSLRKALDENTALRENIVKLERTVYSHRALAETLSGMTAAPLKRREIRIKDSAMKSAIDIPVILSSDIQYGERILFDEMDGINEYSPEVAQRRYRFQIQTSIDLMTTHVNKPAYPAVYMFRLGDSISGRIHDELAETNSLSDPECVRDLTAMEADGIDAVLQAAKKATGQRKVILRVCSIPGNHGRVFKKPRSKGYVRHNWELTLAFNLTREFKSSSDIEFITPMSGDIYEKIYNTSFGLTHGDRIGSRGGTGFIGAAATVLRGTHKTRQMFAGVGKPVQYVVMGHFHDPMWMAHSIVNGCLPGYSEFARDLRFEPAPPSQSMFFVHPQWGVTTRREILLEKATADGRPWSDIIRRGVP